MKNSGQFVVSLDFELIYGISHLDDQPYWEESVRGGRRAISRILQLFEEYDIHATWATVGMLMADNKPEMIACFPKNKPKYKENNYDLSRIGENEDEDPLHYGGSLLKLVRSTPHQEIATHTFSHFYCMQEGQTLEDFLADVQAARKMAEKKDILIQSIVFPKNQVDLLYLKHLGGQGLRAFRGNESCWIYDETGNDTIVKRGLRLLDAYFNISGMHCYNLTSLQMENGIVNVPSSRFLRPFMPKLRALEGMKLRRIKRQMRYAARHGEVFHLWWHPHNFGYHMEENIQNLQKLLEYYVFLQNKYGFRSYNMAEIAEMRA